MSRRIVSKAVLVTVLVVSACTRLEPRAPTPHSVPRDRKRLHLTLLNDEKLTLEGYTVTSDSIVGVQVRAPAGTTGTERMKRAVALRDVWVVEVERFDALRTVALTAAVILAFGVIVVYSYLTNFD